MFEAYVVDAPKGKSVMAISLDEFRDYGFVSIVAVEGVITDRFNNISQNLPMNNSGEYGHVVLTNEPNGTLSFKPMPYRCDPYPTQDMFLGEVYSHPDGKHWAIFEQNGQLSVLYSNERTGFRYVYQQVDSQRKNAKARVKDMLDKGYTRSSFRLEYDAASRTITHV